MAESADKATQSAEEAYAAAAAAKSARSDSAKAEAAPVTIDQPVTSETSAEAPIAAAPAPSRKPGAAKGATHKQPRPAGKKPVAKARRTISKPRRLPAPKAKPAPAVTPVSTLTELKEKIMATAKTTDFTKPITEAMSEMQSKAKTAYDKGAQVAAEATEFAKGNVEALVESGKIYAAGVQDLGRAYAEEAKTAYETLTADLKDLAAVKSPAELFQLQGKLARRNFDALVAYGSKNTDAAIKLASESFAPISGRLSLAAEKVAKAA
ncbi:MAG TPA: phasin family protein [Burkholderiales bacterium]|jgi:phasin family protein|nr:phasin family protein [Burkholderiales bacterium]